MAGTSINILQPGERDDTEDFLVLKISSRDMGFWGVSPALPEEVIKRFPTANVTGLNIFCHVQARFPSPLSDNMNLPTFHTFKTSD